MPVLGRPRARTRTRGSAREQQPARRPLATRSTSELDRAQPRGVGGTAHVQASPVKFFRQIDSSAQRADDPSRRGPRAKRSIVDSSIDATFVAALALDALDTDGLLPRPGGAQSSRRPMASTSATRRAEPRASPAATARPDGGAGGRSSLRSRGRRASPPTGRDSGPARGRTKELVGALGTGWRDLGGGRLEARLSMVRSAARREARLHAVPPPPLAQEARLQPYAGGLTCLLHKSCRIGAGRRSRRG